MLEAIRRNSRNTIIYILFGILIAAFVITFGPGSRGFGAPAGGGGEYAAKVDGETVGDNDFRMAYIALGGANISPQFARMRRLKEFVMDKLIERALLVKEAERLGIQVSQSEVEDMVGDGRMYVIGVPRKIDDYVFVDGKFNYDHFKAVCQNRLGVTVARFLEQQRLELMAERVRQLSFAGAKLTPDSVKTNYELEGKQANLAFVRFLPHLYAEQIDVTPAEIADYKKAHEADLKKYYDEHSYLYTKLDKEAHLARILVAVPKDAKQADVDAAKVKADLNAKRVRGGEDFAAVAKQVSDDEHSKVRGGDLGWRKKGFTAMGPALDDKIFAAKAGDIIGPEKTDRGWEIVKVEGFREGDVPYAQVADELAGEQLRAEKAKAKAKADAEAALAKAKAGQKLEALFPKPAEDEATKDPLAAMGASAKGPQVQETGLFPRKGDMVPDIGVSAEIMKKAFELKVGEVAGPFEASGAWVIIEEKERKEPDMADFEKRKDEITRRYEKEKWAEQLDAWSKDRCNEVKARGDIVVNDEVLQYEGAGAELPVKYEPCASATARM